MGIRRNTGGRCLIYWRLFLSPGSILANKEDNTMTNKIYALLSIILLSLTGCQSEETISSEVKTYSVYIAKETEDGIYEAYDEVQSYHLYPSEDLKKADRKLLLEGASLVILAEPFTILGGTSNQILDPEDFKIDFLPVTVHKVDVMDDTTKAEFVPICEKAVKENSTEVDMDAYITSIKEQSDAIRASLRNDPLTQAEMNVKSQELYELWDGALNYLWGEVKILSSEEEFTRLLDEQRLWIAEKEEKIKNVGKDTEGGSLYPLVVNGEAARITEERVYMLYDLYDVLRLR